MAKFTSICHNQVLCVEPNRNQIVNGMVIPVVGKRIEFVNGEYETNDKKEVEFLTKHKLFGARFFENKKEPEVPVVIPPLDREKPKDPETTVQ